MKFRLDYNKTGTDAIILKEYLISQLFRFKDYNDMTNYIKEEYPYSAVEGTGFWSEILKLIALQKGKEYISQIDDPNWCLDYINYVADRDFTNECNKDLKTKKRKIMDYEKFFDKYKL